MAAASYNAMTSNTMVTFLLLTLVISFQNFRVLPSNTKLVVPKAGLSRLRTTPEPTMTGPLRSGSKLAIPFISPHAKFQTHLKASITACMSTYPHENHRTESPTSLIHKKGTMLSSQFSLTGFTCRKDSVMQIGEVEYKKCNSTHPNCFSNTGSSVYRLEHPGSFHFISGVTGHCGKGQKTIIKVMEPEDESPSLRNGTPPMKSAASRTAMLSSFGVELLA